MRPHRLIVPLVAVFGGLVGAVPALTSGAAPANSRDGTPAMSASFTAVDYRWIAGSGGTTVTIAAGGTVSFSYPSGHSMHNVDFGTGPQPTSCELGGTAQAPPIPATPTPPGWSGSCTFDTPGTYSFHCDMHPGMTGSVIVTGTTTTTTTSTTTTGTTTGTTTATTPATTTTTAPSTASTPTSTPTDQYPPPGGTVTATTTTPYPPYPTTSTPSATGSPRATRGSPLAFAPKRAITLAGTQHGPRVTGSIQVSSFGRGGSAVIKLRARTGGRVVQIGHLRLRHLTPGHVRFSVAVDHAIAVLLHRFGHVDVTVAIEVAGPSGPSVSATEHVRLRS